MGTTIIENAAEEPEIVDLANFLNEMGANVKGAGTNTIKIKGVKELIGTEHNVIPDRIEAATYMVAAAMTKGDITIENVIMDHLKPVTAKLIEAGCEIIEMENAVRVIGPEVLKPIDIKTLPHPGFPTDVQAQFMAMLTVANGSGTVIETVFENRFMHVAEFNRMGADIKIEGRSAIVKGVNQLYGAKVNATDLRAGAALILCGLIAEGETQIGEIYHIQRGYVDIVKVKEPASEEDKAKLSAVIAAADDLNEADYTAQSWAAMKLEYEEAVDALAVAEYKADVDEAIEHLTAAINALVKVEAGTPSGSEEADNTTEAGTSDTSVSDVKTGDANNMMAYIAAAVLALTAGVAVTGRRKIKNVR